METTTMKQELGAFHFMEGITILPGFTFQSGYTYTLTPTTQDEKSFNFQIYR